MVLPGRINDLSQLLYRYLYIRPGPAIPKILRAISTHDKIPGVEVRVSELAPKRSTLITTYVLLPAFNEAASLSRLVPNIIQHLSAAGRPCKVLVVNDGSSDNTSEILCSLPNSEMIQELRHEKNQGYGAALRTGFLWAAEHAADANAVVTLDADNTHDPVYIPTMIEALEQGFSVVTASYTMKGGHATGVPLARRLMSVVLNKLFARAVPLPGVKTYTNGFRAYRPQVVRRVREKYAEAIIEETGFPGGVEFFLKAMGVGGAATEIPFDLHYEERGADSKIHLWATIRKYLRLLRTGGRYVRS